jgi:hypothetical protein
MSGGDECAWAEIFGDSVAAMVDRLVHHSEVNVLKGESYRLRGKREDGAHRQEEALTCSGFGRRFLVRFGPALTPEEAIER